jgi:hypothetical protein
MGSRAEGERVRVGAGSGKFAQVVPLLFRMAQKLLFWGWRGFEG